LRGDPWLWQELRDTLALAQDPGSKDGLRLLLSLAVEELIGADVRNTDDLQIEVSRYPLNGMSGGFVALETWREDLLPLLVDRYTEQVR